MTDSFEEFMNIKNPYSKKVYHQQTFIKEPSKDIW